MHYRWYKLTGDHHLTQTSGQYKLMLKGRGPDFWQGPKYPNSSSYAMQKRWESANKDPCADGWFGICLTDYSNSGAVCSM